MARPTADDPRHGAAVHTAALELVVAVAENDVIGRGNKLPWHLPKDLRRFKALTLGKHILDAAPGCLAALFTGSRGFGPTLSAFYQRIEVMRFFGFAKKLIVDIKMFVVAFAHCSRKALEINRIDQPDA